MWHNIVRGATGAGNMVSDLLFNIPPYLWRAGKAEAAYKAGQLRQGGLGHE